MCEGCRGLVRLCDNSLPGHGGMRFLHLERGVFRFCIFNMTFLHEGVRGQRFHKWGKRVKLTALGFIVLGINYLIVDLLYRCFSRQIYYHVFKHFLHSLPSLGIKSGTWLMPPSKWACELILRPNVPLFLPDSSSFCWFSVFLPPSVTFKLSPLKIPPSL